MTHYVGLDVSQKLTAICVVDDSGHRQWRGQCTSDPEPIERTVRRHGGDDARIGIETGPMTPWLVHELRGRGLAVTCLDARHARAALKMQINKTDQNDAEGLAQIMRTGWYRSVHVKSFASHRARALLGARAQLVGMTTRLSNHIRGVLKTFGMLPGAVVSAFAPADQRRFGYPAMRSGSLQDAERYRGSAHVLPTPRCRRNTLAHAGPATQEVSELVVTAAIPPRRSSALQSKHRSTSAFDAAVILLKSVVQIAICPMPHMAAEFCPDCPGIGIVAIRGDPIRGYAGHRLCRSKEGLRSGKVAVLTQHHVNQGASAIDRAIQIPPTTTHPNVCLVDVPASADFAFSSPTQVLGQCWGEFGFPITHGLIAEGEPADQEHFGQIP